MIDLKLAKEIGATHFIDDVLCKFDYGKLHNYFEPCGFVPTTFTYKRLKELQPINFTELKEFRYTKSVQESLVKISKSCGKRFGIDVGYEDLPDVVESIINPEPEMVIEYVKVEFDKISDVALIYEAGDVLFTTHCDTGDYVEINVYGAISLYHHGDSLYRKIEKPADWKEVARGFVKDSEYLNLDVTIRELISPISPINAGDDWRAMADKEVIKFIKRIYPLVK